MHQTILTAVLLLTTITTASAQDRTLTARTLCFSYHPEVKSIWVPGGEEREMVEQKLFTAVHSLPFPMRTTEGKAVFYLPADDPESPYRPLPPVTLPDSREILFLFLPSNDKDSPYHIVSLADDEQRFPYGSVRIMNLSKESVRIHLGEHSGDKAVLLTPGKSELVESIRRVDDFNRFPVLAEYRTDAGMAKFHNTAWRSIADKRDLAIVFNDPKSGRPRIRHYEDAKPAELDLEP